MRLQFDIFRHGAVLPASVGTAGASGLAVRFPLIPSRPGDREAGGVQGRRLRRRLHCGFLAAGTAQAVAAPLPCSLSSRARSPRTLRIALSGLAQVSAACSRTSGGCSGVDVIEHALAMGQLAEVQVASRSSLQGGPDPGRKVPRPRTGCGCRERRRLPRRPDRQVASRRGYASRAAGCRCPGEPH